MKPIHDVITRALETDRNDRRDPAVQATHVIEALRREGYEIERRRGA